ncbi:MAG TPA: chemotaxis protein CheA [Bryobacteraceae bacterium]|nr:chemotaxis protein CheA [Bryobacteraceae bacterium]
MIDHRQAFLDEARELLVELESALLEMDQNRGDAEIVARAFRALHTIKGSGAMFGFDDISGFAHHLESAFDQLRKGQLTVTTDLINLSLGAADQIKKMLDAATGQEAADTSRSEAILTELRFLRGAPDAERPPSPARTETAPAAEGGPVREWRIRFRPAPEALLNGTNPLRLLGELREMGELRVQVDTAALPPLTEKDPERCHLAWDMLLETGADAAAIRDVFIFVENDCELSIQPVEPASPAAQAPVPAASEVRRPAANSNTSSIRVSAEKLDQLVNLVGELVTVQARLGAVAGRRDDPEVRAVSEEVDRLTSSLRENSMSIRMLPLRATFERFRRLVHDLGQELHKQVELTVEGAETELDKTVIDQLNDPLVHLIRNSMDHGIETPEARVAAGKSPTATVHLSAQHSGANVLIRVRDDGRGLDVEAVRARAIEQGLIHAGSQLSEAEIVSLILAPGFSTARAVTDVSGRGVGMDVVRRNVEALRGSLEVASIPGAGVTVTLRLPLTLAIIDGLLVRVGEAYFVLPLANSLECVELTGRDIEAAHGNHLANVRGQLVPYIRLREYFRVTEERPEREQVMVVETDQGRYGFAVDQVLGDHQTVIKNLGRVYRNTSVVSGATILGNGTVALILDPNRLVQSAIRSALRTKSSGAIQSQDANDGAKNGTQRLQGEKREVVL